MGLEEAEQQAQDRGGEEEGEVLVFGFGECGQLGHGGGGGVESGGGKANNEHVPRRVEALVGKRVVQMAPGVTHTAVLTSDGEVLTFGDGACGQLGHGGMSSEPVPRRVEGSLAGKRVVQIAAGVTHTAVSTSDGEVFTFGSGVRGKLGHGRVEEWDHSDHVPRRVDALVGRRVVQMAAGSYHTAVLTGDGEVLTFGDGVCGQLGHNGRASEPVPRRVEGSLAGKRAVQVVAGVFHTAVLTSDGEVFTFGWGQGSGILGHRGEESDEEHIELVPRRVEALVEKRVVQIAAGGTHMVVLASDGEVLTFGDGVCGRLGHGRVNSEFVPRRVDALVGKRVVQVVAGSMHTAVLTSDGEVLTFGKGGYGQLGHGGRASELVPRRVETLVAVGKRVVQMAAGGCHMAVLAMLRS